MVHRMLWIAILQRAKHQQIFLFHRFISHSAYGILCNRFWSTRWGSKCQRQIFKYQSIKIHSRYVHALIWLMQQVMKSLITQMCISLSYTGSVYLHIDKNVIKKRQIHQKYYLYYWLIIASRIFAILCGFAQSVTVGLELPSRSA